MPMKVQLGLAKKIGQPDYGSLGASCNIELELDGGLLFNDLDGLQQKVRAAYTVCRQAVDDELASQTGSSSSALNSHGADHVSTHTNGRDHSDGDTAARGNPNRDCGGANGSQNGHQSNGNRRAATSAQVRALHSIATRQNFNLTDLIRERFHIFKAEELSLREASQLIDELNATHGSRA